MEGPSDNLLKCTDELQLFKNDISRTVKYSGRKKRDLMLDGKNGDIRLVKSEALWVITPNDDPQ